MLVAVSPVYLSAFQIEAYELELRYLILPTSPKGSPSSRTVWCCSPRMHADVALVFDALMRIMVNPFKQALYLSVVVVQDHVIVDLSKA